MAIRRNKKGAGKEPPRPERGRGGGLPTTENTLPSNPQLDVEKIKEGAEPYGGLAPFESEKGEPDEEWSSGEVSMDAVVNGDPLQKLIEKTEPIGEEPDWPKGRLMDRLMTEGLTAVPSEISEQIARQLEGEIESGEVEDLEHLHKRIREFAEMVLGIEKPVTYWEKLAQLLEHKPEEAEKQIQQQWDRVDVMVPDFVLENLERLGGGETRLLRVPASVVVEDFRFSTRKAEQMTQSEDAQKAGSGSQELNEKMVQWFGVIHEEASAVGGQLISLGGDESMYMFTGHQHQERALTFASRVKSRFSGQDEIGLKGGVATGEVLMGAVKLDEKRSLPVVLGEPVMGARMMERLALRDEVMVHSGMMEFLQEGQTTKKDMGLVLNHYDGLEIMGEFAGKAMTKEQSASVSKHTLKQLQQAERFLHPHLRYVGEYQGIPQNLYEGERSAATVTFIDMDIDDLHHRIVSEVGAEATAADSPHLADLEKMLQETSRMARDRHSIMEKIVFSPSHTKIMVVSTRGERRAANGLRLSMDEVTGLLQRADIDASAGVASGIIYRGQTGPIKAGKPKGEWGVSGYLASLAARLAAKAERGVVLADALTVLQGDESLKITTGQPRNLRALEMKGVTGGGAIFQIYEVEDKGATLEHLSTNKSVGREQQKEQMRRAFRRMMEANTQVVETVIADAGEGKSLLTDEMIWEHYFEKEDAGVLKGRANEASIDKMYSLWRLPAEKMFGIKSVDDAKKILDKITGKLFEVNPEYVKYAELFAEQFGLLDISVPDDQHFAGFGAKAAEVFSVLMREQAEAKPLIVVMEDLHWADRASKELLKSILQKTQNSRILFHLVARPEEEMDFYRLSPDKTYPIELGPLPREVWADFVATQFPIAGMREFADLEKTGSVDWKKDRKTDVFHLMRANERFADETYAVSGGNPYVARQLINYLLHYGELNPDKKNEKTGKPFEFFQESDSGEYSWGDYIDYKTLGEVAKLMDIVTARILDSMRSVNERACFKIAAKLGREFTSKQIEAITGLNPRLISEYFERWKRLGCVEMGAEYLSFSHANLRNGVEAGVAEIVLEDAGGNVRILTDADVSRLVGEYLEKHGGKLEDLARLFGMSDNTAKGMEYNRRLGDTAFGRQDAVSYQLAVTAYGRAIELFKNNFVPMTGEELDSEQLRENARREEQWRQLSREKKKQTVNDLLQSHIKLAKTHSRVGLGNDNREQALQALDAGRSWFEQYRSLLTKDETTHLDAQLATARADMLVRMSRYSDAELELHRIETLMREMESEEINEEHQLLLANYYDAQGLVFARTKRLDEAMLAYEKALELVTDETDDLEEFEVWDRVTAHKVDALYKQGKHELARALQDNLLETEEERGAWASAAVTRIGKLGVMSRGDLEEVSRARDLVPDTLALVRDHAPAFEINALRAWSTIEESLRNYPKVAEIMDRFVTMIDGHWGETDLDPMVNAWKAGRALLAVKLGDAGRAREIISELPLVASNGAMSGRARAMVKQVRAMLADLEGKSGVAEDEFKDALESMKKLGNLSDEAAVLADFAEFKVQQGRRTEAIADLRKALEIYEQEEDLAEIFWTKKMLQEIEASS